MLIRLRKEDIMAPCVGGNPSLVLRYDNLVDSEIDAQGGVRGLTDSARLQLGVGDFET